jgi:hypothetical protein
MLQVKLPPNCKTTLTDRGVRVKMTYSTKLDVGEHKDKGITVFQGRDYYTKKGKFRKGSKYYSFEFDITTQINLNRMISEIYTKYFEYKQKGMILKCLTDISIANKQIEALSKSMFPGTWDLRNLNNNNELPPPPQQITLDF